MKKKQLIIAMTSAVACFHDKRHMTQEGKLRTIKMDGEGVLEILWQGNPSPPLGMSALKQVQDEREISKECRA